MRLCNPSISISNNSWIRLATCAIFNRIESFLETFMASSIQHNHNPKQKQKAPSQKTTEERKMEEIQPHEPQKIGNPKTEK
jgi:hypothetical protein